MSVKRVSKYVVDPQFAMYFIDYSGYVGNGLFRKDVQLAEIFNNSIVFSYWKRFASETWIAQGRS